MNNMPTQETIAKVYSGLSELEKIPLRIYRAKEIAKEDIINGIDLKPILKICIEREYFCGAEGIKLAMQEAGLAVEG